MLKIPCNLRFLIRMYSIKVAPNFSINKPQMTHLAKATLQYPLQKLDNTNSREPSTKSQWTEQQLQVLAAIKHYQSVFITGFAGTGKTYLIKEIIKLLCDNHGKKHVCVTGSTGVVACAIGGQTLHSFAGVGLAEADAQTLLSRVRRNKIVYKRWKSVKALVIDEISMVDAELFDKLQFIARNIKENDEHWGGIQLVVSGDFSQLPPVNLGKVLDVNKEFAFEADSWDDSFQLQVCLTGIFRQSDPNHIRLLQGIRKGELDAEGLRLLEQCRSVEEPDETVVRFYPRNDDVNRVNNERLNSLNQDVVVYDAYDVGKKPWIDQLERGIASHELKLCVGARTMLTKNLDVKNKLVNGSTGTVIGFVKVDKSKVRKICNDKVLPMVKFDNGCVMVVEPCRWDVMVGEKKGATRLQLPLILAWALSIHKSQGMTLSRLHTDLSSAFGHGMVYVALSRVESLEGFSFSSGIDPSRILSHPKVLEYYKKNF